MTAMQYCAVQAYMAVECNATYRSAVPYCNSTNSAEQCTMEQYIIEQCGTVHGSVRA